MAPKVVDALLLADWNIDRDGERALSRFYKRHAELVGPRIAPLFEV